MQRRRFLLMRAAQKCAVPRCTAGPTVTDPTTQVQRRFVQDLGHQVVSHGSFRLVSVEENVQLPQSHIKVCVAMTTQLSLVTNWPLTHPGSEPMS